MTWQLAVFSPLNADRRVLLVAEYFYL